MGRRSQHPPEILKRMIVDAAEDIVRSGGFAALSAREVAKRIDYSPGTIYNMYDSLDDVVLLVQARVLDRLKEALSKAEGETPELRLQALGRAYIDFTHAEPNLWNLLFEHRMSDGRAIPDWYQSKLDGLLSIVEECVAPFFTSDDGASRRRAARVLWTSVHGISSLSTSGKLTIITPDNAPDLVEDLVRNYVAGLRQPA